MVSVLTNLIHSMSCLFTGVVLSLAYVPRVTALSAMLINLDPDVTEWCALKCCTTCGIIGVTPG